MKSDFQRADKSEGEVQSNASQGERHWENQVYQSMDPKKVNLHVWKN